MEQLCVWGKMNNHAVSLLTFCSVQLKDVFEYFRAADFVRDSDTQHRRLCVALSKIVLVYPHTVGFAADYLSNNKSFYYNPEKSSDGEPVRKKSKKVSAIK